MSNNLKFFAKKVNISAQIFRIKLKLEVVHYLNWCMLEMTEFGLAKLWEW